MKKIAITFEDKIVLIREIDCIINEDWKSLRHNEYIFLDEIRDKMCVAYKERYYLTQKQSGWLSSILDRVERDRKHKKNKVST